MLTKTLHTLFSYLSIFELEYPEETSISHYESLPRSTFLCVLDLLKIRQKIIGPTLKMLFGKPLVQKTMQKKDNHNFSKYPTFCVTEITGRWN